MIKNDEGKVLIKFRKQSVRQFFFSSFDMEYDKSLLDLHKNTSTMMI